MYLIIGASSFIGRHLYSNCKRYGIDVMGTFYNHSYNAEWIRYDMCTDDLQECLAGKIPSVIIICSANTSIDSCKRNESASIQLNVTGVQKIVRQAEVWGSKCVFLSSEAVFDGKAGMYKEEDIPNPITIYGRQKLEAEDYIADRLKHYLIFRISRAASSYFGQQDIFNEFFRKMSSGEEITCLKNQSFCITEVNDIAQAIIKALQQDINGLYHLSSANYISRYELAKLYAKRMFADYNKIVEKEYHELAFADNRHIYAGLNGDKLVDLLQIRYMSISQILDHYMKTYENYLNV